MSDFSIETAITLVESGVDFPVDFDDLWQWVEYSRKDNALVVLQKEMVESIDFIISLQTQENKNGGLSGRPTTKYYMTVESAKHFAMLARTPKGKQVRNYFIEAERRMRMLEKERVQPAAELSVNELAARLTLALTSEVQELKAKVEVVEQQSTDVLHQVEKLTATKRFREVKASRAKPNSYRNRIDSEVEDIALNNKVPKQDVYKQLYAHYYALNPQHDSYQDYAIYSPLSLSRIAYLEEMNRIAELHKALKSFKFTM